MYQNQGKNNKSSALHDIVFLMAAGFFILFMVALWYVNPIAKLGKIDNKAEFVITMTWPADINSDMDTWVMDPNGILIWYSAKTPNDSPVALERDDLGHSNDTIIVDGSPVVIKQNQENISIRAILPGEYVVNVFWYSNTSGAVTIPVTLKVEKLNPTVKKIFYTVEPVKFTYRGQEKTIVRFTVDPDGSVSDVITEPEIALSKIRSEQSSTSTPRNQGGGYLGGDWPPN